MGYVKPPRDGLRAKCPEFVQRCSLGAFHWIVCAGGRPQFKTAAERDDYYREHCCGPGAKSCAYSCTHRIR